MRIAYLVLDAHGPGGTERSVITQANALAARHDVTILSVLGSAGPPRHPIDPRVSVRSLSAVPDPGASPAQESRLVPRRWDAQFSALTDVALEAALPAATADVVVTVTPALLACAVQLLPHHTVVVHQEHRSSSQRTSGMEALLAFAPRADAVALLTPSMAEWLRKELGPVGPPIVVVPNALPAGPVPRSALDRPVITTAGRLVAEKQYPRLVHAFAEIADDLPDWRLRILGDGPQRMRLVREVRKRGLWDRVELPGSASDMRGEWARSSLAAVSSRAEGFPLILQEAMAAGVPCVSFDCASGPREIVRHEVNGLLVAPDSTAGLASAMLRLATDDGLRHRLGRGALATVAAYDAEVIARRWEEVYADAIDRRGGRTRLAAAAAAPPADPAEPAAPNDPVDPEPVGVTPLQARHAALAGAVRAARAASDRWLVLPPHGLGGPVVVLAMAARDDFLAALPHADLPGFLCLRDPEAHGWPERRGRVAELAEDLRRGRTPVVAIEPWPLTAARPSLLGQGCSVDVEFWEAAPDGTLVAPRPNRFGDRLVLDAQTETVEIDVDGVTVRTLPLLAEPGVDECTFPIDVVHTWVDGSDPAWGEARAARLAELSGAGAVTAQTRASSGRARFVSRDELRYSLRSVHLFAPWVRRIHLVTAGQVPAWLDTTHSQVTVVDHAAILPPEALPTFNSHAIETALHRVPGLTEHFVYFNDDFLLGRPVGPEAFFTPSGLAATYLSTNSIGLVEKADAPPYLLAAWHNRRLLEQAFGRVITAHLAHAPYPLLRSVVEDAERRFPAAIAATARAPFRSATDVSLLSSLAPHLALLSGKGFVSDPPRAFVNVANSDVEAQLRQVLERQQDFVCLADHHDHALSPERLDAVLRDFLDAYLPVPAPWELDAD